LQEERSSAEFPPADGIIRYMYGWGHRALIR
jgi:hypothetical protein